MRIQTSHALAAKAIRKELKGAFPKIKFIVRSSSFAGGNSISVKWTDGPTEKDVSQITYKYEYGTFDGMTDCYNYDKVRKDLPQVKYLSTYRSYATETLQKVLKENEGGYPQLKAQDNMNENNYALHEAFPMYWTNYSFAAHQLEEKSL